MSHNDFDKRMKDYEKVFTSQKVIPHMPIIVRIDGKCFHNYTKQCTRPFDSQLKLAFQMATVMFKNEFHYDLAYGQSDEVSFLIYHPNTRTQEDFEGKIQKLCSVMASVFTANFNRVSDYDEVAYFDCRIFQLPVFEVVNYFIWRQKDAVRNSIQMVGQSQFSSKQLHSKSCNDIQEMLMTEKNINWNNVDSQDKRGWCVDCEGLNIEIPTFTENRGFIEHIIKEKEKLS